MGAVMPSGRVLARTMAQYVDINSTGPVVELGPGTGAITNALIEHGVDQKRLVLVEYNPGFCALLRDRYPQAKVVQGDAYTLRDSLWDVLSAPGIRRGVRPAAGDQADADAPETDPRCLPRAGAGCAVRAVHLFGGAADPEIAARRVHRSLRAHLDEPSAGPRLGVSQGLILGRALARPVRPEAILNHVRAENPGDPRLAAHRLAQCEAGGGRGV